MQVNSQIKQLMDQAETLSSLFARETSLLKEMKVSDITALQEEKARLTKEYAENFHAFKKAQTDGLVRLSDVPREVFAQLKKTAQNFEEATKENEIAIRAAQEAQSRFLGTVVNAAELQKRPSSYDGDGNIQNNRSETDSISSVLDQSL